VSNLDRDLASLLLSGQTLTCLVTREEDRALALADRVARAVKLPRAVWSSTRGLEPLDVTAQDPRAALRVLESAPPHLAVLLDFHAAFRDPLVVRHLRDRLPALEAKGHALVVVAPLLEVPVGLVDDCRVLRLPLPEAAEREHILHTLVLAKTSPADHPGMHRSMAASPDLHRLVTASAGLTGAQARRAFQRALREDPKWGPRCLEVVLTEKRALLARDVGLELVETGDGLDDVGGLEGFKAWLAERAKAFEPGAKGFGLGAPRGVLLVGVQGCGKSLSAKAVARTLTMPLVRLDMPRVLGAGEAGGSAEESLARALSATEALAPVALWIDEIEKGFAGTAPGKGGDPRAARVLGLISTWLQERTSPVFVIATANDVSQLPPELLRRGRLDELFFVDLPDIHARAAILALHLRKRGQDPTLLDVRQLATQCPEFSGAELEQVVVGGLHHAFAQGRPLRPADLVRVAQEIVPLAVTYEEQIKALRAWARHRARPAGRQDAVVDLFRRVDPGAPGALPDRVDVPGPAR
jgi:hypothetical protein